MISGRAGQVRAPRAFVFPDSAEHAEGPGGIGETRSRRARLAWDTPWDTLWDTSWANIRPACGRIASRRARSPAVN
ncbi:hypothetical protein GCM10022252_71450 [Streptosporangium oxazolinicum]|uniref:Uncharacterized protein n=1 Tax=Streptosporangium oxazolinicum TaxID=909287 RepID=A0ABP8BJ03_9ACTN